MKFKYIIIQYIIQKAEHKLLYNIRKSVVVKLARQ